MIVLYALKSLYELGLLENKHIIVAFTGDEESTGKPLSISRKALIDAGKNSDIALGFENSTGFNQATIARRGTSSWRIESKGVRAHSSGILEKTLVLVLFLNYHEYFISFLKKLKEKIYSLLIQGLSLEELFGVR